MKYCMFLVIVFIVSCSFAPKGYENLNNQFDFDNAFIRAVSDGNIEAVEYLIPKVDVNMSVVLEGSPIVIAVKNQDVVVTERLIVAKADINVPDSAGNYPIHIAVKNSDVATLKVLVSAKVKINKQNVSGDTALHVAVVADIPKDKRQEIVKILLEKNADSDVFNDENLTAKQLAHNKKQSDIIALLGGL
ncbi:ankyrin repeat domain-containing protein [Candidatus Uabimicrobium sp. HlEnr_7]|uniref:ankyrin repeat domain-containing protein n=1 Tax=Candidatus Uabimicrobium helgolandensis TaxID=3095367 RepID=UPI003559261A